jgi:hypothetical protein
MDKPRVYLETSIPSFYHEVRTDPESVARRLWTRRWWSSAGTRYDVYSSAAVVDELQLGEYPTRSECLAFIRKIPLLPVVPEIIDIVDTYIQRRVMPSDPGAMLCIWAWPLFTSATSW